MDERTRGMLAHAITDFVHELLSIADQENYDRDDFVKASAEMFSTMAEISTFEYFDLSGGDG